MACVQWAPKHLTQKQNRYRMGVSMKHLMHYHEMGQHSSHELLPLMKRGVIALFRPPNDELLAS